MTKEIPTVHFVFERDDEEVEVLFDGLVTELGKQGITAEWGKDASTLPGENGFTIAHTTVPDLAEDLEICILGQRTLNRQQRLVLAERIGAPVARWIAPTGPEALVEFCEKLETDSVVFKQDKSFRKWGVWIHRLRDPWPAELDADTDVFMETLTDDPNTYKVEVFHDTVVGGRIFPTRSIMSPDFYEQSPPPELFEPPADVIDFSRAIGREFLAAGCGYTSIDWMRESDKYLIVEINTCGVGLGNSWTHWPHFVPTYAAAISELIASGAPLPSLRESFEFGRKIGRPGDEAG